MYVCRQGRKFTEFSLFAIKLGKHLPHCFSDTV